MFKLMADQGPLNTVAFLNDWQTSIRMYFLYTGLQSGLFKALKIPCSKDALTEKLSPKRLDLFDALLDVGLTTKELGLNNGLYRLKGRRAKALANDPDEIFTGIVQANVTYYHIVFHDAAPRMAGGPLADLLEIYGDVIARFSRSTEPFVLDFLQQALKKREAPRLLEIGCGSGVHLRSAHTINPKVSGTGIDINPKVAEAARKHIVEWGLDQQFNIVAGDIRNAPNGTEGPFDMITLFNLIYYFKDDERPALFRQLKEKLADDGVFLLVTMVSSKAKDAMAAALNLATVSEQGTTALPDEQVLADQLKVAGFSKVTFKRIMPKSSFMGFIANAGSA